MGILVTDSITLPNGISVNNFIITVKGYIRSIEKTYEVIPETQEEKEAREALLQPEPRVTKYRVIYTAYYYANSYVDQYFYESHHSLMLPTSDIQQNIYDKIYADIKSRYTNYTDV